MKNYPTVNRVPLRDLKDRYKQEFNVILKFSDLIEKIESTKLFQITNVHESTLIELFLNQDLDYHRQFRTSKRWPRNSELRHIII